MHDHAPNPSSVDKRRLYCHNKRNLLPSAKKTMINDSKSEWHFDFGLYSKNTDNNVPREQCEELMTIILNWANDNEIVIGGGYREFTEDEQ